MMTDRLRERWIREPGVPGDAFAQAIRPAMRTLFALPTECDASLAAAIERLKSTSAAAPSPAAFQSGPPGA